METIVTQETKVKIHDEVKEIRALAVKKFNTRNNTSWPEVITLGRFFERLEDILLENWSKFEPNGISPVFKNELANVISGKITAPPTMFSFLYTSLYIEYPGVLSVLLEDIIKEYDPELETKSCNSIRPK